VGDAEFQKKVLIGKMQDISRRRDSFCLWVTHGKGFKNYTGSVFYCRMVNL
jgi:hypothetical protein